MSALSGVSASFPFDEWMQLWQTDPAAAEARRKAETEALIESAPEHLRERLTRLQWRIDQERGRHKTPLGVASAITRMMFERYTAPDGLYDQIMGPVQELPEKMAELHALLLRLGAILAEEAKASAQRPVREEKI